MKNPLKKVFEPKLKLVKGTRFISSLFIVTSMLIAGAVLFAANMYYNIDTGEVVMEQIQRVTGTIRATASLIVGGTASQDPASGTKLEIASGDVLLSAADQVLRFSGGHASHYVGLKATTTLSTTRTYILPAHDDSPPSADYVLTWQAGDQLQWKTATGTGVGTITAVGNVESGRAFTSDGSGSTLWFHSGVNTGALTVDTLGFNATYTLPAISGSNYLALTSGGLGTGGVLFANAGLIATSSNFYWDNTSRYLRLGDTTAAGELRVYSSHANGYYLGFTAPAGMSTTTTYSWPTSYGTNNYVLTTNGSGNLVWSNVEGVGGITGAGNIDRLARWTSSSSLATSSIIDSYSGTSLTIDASGDITIDNKLTVSGSGGVTAALYTSATTTTIGSGTGDIVLDPATGIVKLSSGTWIETDSGYEIGKAGTEVLREMIPIMGFDLPVQTATTSYIDVSRVIQDYPFEWAATGTDRVHKLVFRYAASTTAAVDFRVFTNTEYSSSTLPTTQTANLDQGEAYISTISIPTTTVAWKLQARTANEPDTVRIFQIFLAAYDVVQ